MRLSRFSSRTSVIFGDFLGRAMYLSWRVISGRRDREIADCGGAGMSTGRFGADAIVPCAIFDY